jgi:hypothetical protein
MPRTNVPGSPTGRPGDHPMKSSFLLFLPAALSLLFAGGCSGPTSEKLDMPRVEGRETEITEALAKLPPPDRKLAEEQRFCAVYPKNRLGSMGEPVKVMVKDQPVFLCCASCRKKALANPDKTLKQVEALKAKNRPEAPK